MARVRMSWRVLDRRTFLRGVLGVAATGTLAGCGLVGPPEPPVSHEFDELMGAAAGLADRYDATLSAHPDLVPRLGPVRDAHRAHAAALAQAMGQPTPAADRPADEPPADRAAAVSALSDAEKSARDQAVSACLAGGPRAAMLLGAIAAARASHLEVLR